jgi:glucosamine--fructose-6-phosphate aminotransferase (isomerizing)
LSDLNTENSNAKPETIVPSLLEAEIVLQPRVLTGAKQSFPKPIADLLARLRDRNVDDWVVTGCGDSLFAGLCAEVWFARIAGARLRPLQAMHLSRETYESLTPRSVVFAISHSGTTARVVEAARAAHSRGAFVVAVTANATSELARGADFWIDNTVREERSNCRTASFQAVSLLMRMIAEALGEQTQRVFHRVDLSLVERYVETSRRQIDELTDVELGGDHWIFTGSGLGLAAAEYGMAKAYEGATLPAHSVELEQFIHCEIFTVQPGTHVVIVCPLGRASSRAIELANGLAKLGAVTIAVTNDVELARAATHVVWLPEALHEDDLTFAAILPLQWLALRLARLRGENPDVVANKWVNRPLIDNSTQWGAEKYVSAAAISTGAPV